jgi:uncharacterized membrane protein
MSRNPRTFGDPTVGQHAITAAALPRRVASVDVLRGLVMIVMALDHVRDFIHQGAMVASPTDLATTTPLLFTTRWVTHLCAPTFALTAGIAAWFWWQGGGRSRAELSKFLVLRGLLLIALELVVMRFIYSFSWSAENPVILLVLWSLGLSMIVLAALVWLPLRLLAAFAVAAILLHPLLDGITADEFGAAAGLWNIVHQVGAFQLGAFQVITPYPLIPWVAVMALGFSLGPLFRTDPAKRRRIFALAGAAAVAAFTVMRLVNRYGDPAPWSVQDSPVFTVLSFLNVTKYPPSPAFLLATLGAAFLLLALLDRASTERNRPAAVAAVFGRVPLFFFVFHFLLAHLIATAIAFAAYGGAALDFVFNLYPSLGGSGEEFPPHFGYSLATTYPVWLVVLVIGYPACRWYAGLKARRRDWWLSYL